MDTDPQATPITPATHTTAHLALLAALLFGTASGALAGSLHVRVTTAGQPAAGASVCVGSSTNRSQIFQGTTDRNGLVSFGGIPPEPFVVTAHQGPRGAEQALRLATPGGLGLLRTEIQLPATASGPTCLQGSQQLIQPPPSPAPRPPIGALQRREFCFGALGNQCGQPQGLIPPSALCSNGVCFINGGSWAHDECCARRRGGVMCDVPNPDG